MQQVNLTQMGLTDISFEESIIIEGGNYATGYAAGATVRKWVDNVLEVVGIAALF